MRATAAIMRATAAAKEVFFSGGEGGGESLEGRQQGLVGEQQHIKEHISTTRQLFRMIICQLLYLLIHYAGSCL